MNQVGSLVQILRGNGVLVASTFEDDAFITRLRQQDDAAFCALVKAYHLRLKGLAGAVVGPQWAEDVVQDAWVSIYRALPEFAGRSSLATWLFVIVRNEARSKLQKEGRQPNVDTSSMDAEEQVLEEWLARRFNEDGTWREPISGADIHSPEQSMEQDQLLACIEKSVEALRPKQRAVFTLRDLDQLPLEEICNILDISHSNVRVLLHRARQEILKVVTHYQETGEC